MEPVQNHIANKIANETYDGLLDNFIDRHKDCAIINDIVTRPEIVERMSSIYGPNLICRSSRIWPKPPGKTHVPWHQDGIDYALHPTTTVSAWVALTEATTENGCIRLIPKSHRRGYTAHGEVEEPGKTVFSKKISAEDVSEEDMVEMELEPGEFFLFTERTYHSSTKNVSDGTRVGLSIRASPSFVHLNPDEDRPKRAAMLLDGENLNPTTPTVSPPSDCQH
jgi:ectoine hydroxylase-related dioxygenase (phytanoyl-CoA dioxygenase family)